MKAAAGSYSVICARRRSFCVLPLRALFGITGFDHQGRKGAFFPSALRRTPLPAPTPSPGPAWPPYQLASPRRHQQGVSHTGWIQLYTMDRIWLALRLHYPLPFSCCARPKPAGVPSRAPILLKNSLYRGILLWHQPGFSVRPLFGHNNCTPYFATTLPTDLLRGGEGILDHCIF